MSPPWCLGFLAARHCGPHRLCLLVEPSGSGQVLKDTGETGLEERPSSGLCLRIVSQDRVPAVSALRWLRPVGLLPSFSSGPTSASREALMGRAQLLGWQGPQSMSQASCVSVPRGTPWTVLGSRVSAWGGSQLVLAGPAPVVVPGRSHHWSHLSGCPWPPANPESQGLDGSFSAELSQAGSVGWLPPPLPLLSLLLSHLPLLPGYSITPPGGGGEEVVPPQRPSELERAWPRWGRGRWTGRNPESPVP